MKDVVIVANFCRDFSKTDNGRFMYLCKELSKRNNVEIITSDFSHTLKKQKEKLVHNWPFKVTFIHEPGYKRNISIKRFISHWVWGKKVHNYLNKRKKADVIYCAVPSLTGAYESSEFCKKNKIRFIVDIQDLWPEAFRLVLNIPIVSDILFAPFGFVANRIYSRADVICGVSNTYVNRALKFNKNQNEGYAVFLGTQLSQFDKYALNNPVEKKSDDLWMGYCGTLGASYDITVVLEALRILKERGLATPKFIVMGDGEKKREFENYAKKHKIDCLFTGRLRYDQMCGRLASCDIAANPIMHDAAQSIINKHGDYCAAGLPVINTQECKEYRNLVDEYKMGFNVDNCNAEEFAEKIKLLMNDVELRKKMGQNARRCAEERFDRASTYKLLVGLIEG